MIAQRDLNNIESLTKEYWLEQVNQESFRSIFSGKEIGHRIADYVDDRTTELLAKNLNTKKELHKTGKVKARSMGDIWVKSNNVLNPLNVKAGEAGKNGQPNLVALNKILDFLLNDRIDSYYLLIVKMKVKGKSIIEEFTEDLLAKSVIEPKVYLVDMLDHLEHVAFDSGPGQLMLKEKQFYLAMEKNTSSYEEQLAQKIERLVDLREDGDRRLIENRERTLHAMRKKAATYRKKVHHEINQKELNFG